MRRRRRRPAHPSSHRIRIDSARHEWWLVVWRAAHTLGAHGWWLDGTERARETFGDGHLDTPHTAVHTRRAVRRGTHTVASLVGAQGAERARCWAVAASVHGVCAE